MTADWRKIELAILDFLRRENVSVDRGQVLNEPSEYDYMDLFSVEQLAKHIADEINVKANTANARKGG